MWNSCTQLASLSPHSFPRLPEEQVSRETDSKIPLGKVETGLGNSSSESLEIALQEVEGEERGEGLGSHFQRKKNPSNIVNPRLGSEPQVVQLERAEGKESA